MLAQSQAEFNNQGSSSQVKPPSRNCLPQTGYASILAQSQEEFKAAMRSRPKLFQGCNPLMVYRPQNADNTQTANPQIITARNETKISTFEIGYSRKSSEKIIGGVTDSSPIRVDQLSISQETPASPLQTKKELVDFYGNQYEPTKKIETAIKFKPLTELDIMMAQTLATPSMFPTQSMFPKDIHQEEYKCTHPNCEKVFPSILKQIIHVKTHLSHKCKFKGCSLQFKTKRELTNHLSTHCDMKVDIAVLDEPKKEETKQVIFEKAREIKVHRKRARLYLCRFPNCNQGFAKNDLLVSHEQKHIVGRVHACSLCDETFFTEIQVQTHMYSHRESHKPKSLYYCELLTCDAEFRFEEDIHGHENKHRELTPFQCQFCDAKFYALSLLQLHYTQCVPIDIYDTSFYKNQNNQKVKKVKCAHCKTSFFDDEELVNHFHSTHFVNGPGADTINEPNHLEYIVNTSLIKKEATQNVESSPLKYNEFFTDESPSKIKPEFDTEETICEMSVSGQSNPNARSFQGVEFELLESQDDDLIPSGFI
jgi:hypothetical protein